MSNFLQFAASLREQMHATLSRSDVLKALVWPTGLLMSSLVALVFGNAPTWMLVIFVILLVLDLLLYGSAYVFCLFNDRDSLRSEKYSLHKLAIERGIFGDDKNGIIDIEEPPQGKLLPHNAPSVSPESGQ